MTDKIEDIFQQVAQRYGFLSVKNTGTYNVYAKGVLCNLIHYNLVYKRLYWVSTLAEIEGDLCGQDWKEQIISDENFAIPEECLTDMNTVLQKYKEYQIKLKIDKLSDDFV